MIYIPIYTHTHTLTYVYVCHTHIPVDLAGARPAAPQARYFPDAQSYTAQRPAAADARAAALEFRECAVEVRPTGNRGFAGVAA